MKSNIVKHLLIVLCIYLVSCTSTPVHQAFTPIRDLAKEHFNIVSSKNFNRFKDVYRGIDKEDSNLPKIFNQINALLALGDVFLPPDSLIWVDTIDVKVGLSV